MKECFIGGIAFSCGRSVDIDEIVRDEALATLLKDANHRLRMVPVHDGVIDTLVEEAVAKSLADSGREASEIDAVLLVSNHLESVNNLEPTWISELDQRIGLARVPHLQLGMAGCAGLHHALQIAVSQIRGSGHRNVLIIAFDAAGGALKRIYGEGSDFVYVTGDAAASCVVSSDRASMDFRVVGGVVTAYDSRLALQSSVDDDLDNIGQLFRQAYGASGSSAGDMRMFVCNNYSLEATCLFSQLAEIDDGRVYADSISEYAHCFCADNLINLRRILDRDLVSGGDQLMLFSLGLYQYGACVVESVR